MRRSEHNLTEGHMYQIIEGEVTEVVRCEEGLVPVWHPAARQLPGQLAMKLEFDYVPFETDGNVINREIKL